MSTLLLSVIEYIGVGNLLTAISLSLLVFWFLRVNYVSNWTNLPPGPPLIPYPFDGLLAFLRMSNRFGRLIQINNRYGDIAYLRVGKKKMVLISSPELVKDVIVKQADVTSNREVPPFFFYSMAYTGGIIFSHGEPWQELRRFSLSALRNFGMGKKSLEYRITEEARVLCDTIAQLDEFEPTGVLNAAVSNIICSITFGRRFEYDDPVFKDMIVRLRTLTTGVDINPILRELFVRFPLILKTPLMQAPLNNLCGLKDFINAEVKQHTDTYDQHDVRDIIDMYLAEVEKNEASAAKTYLTRDSIWMCVFDLFLAGTETTSSALLWLLLCLAGNPDVQKRVANEIDQVIGRERAPCVEDRTNMPYTEATLLEVMRFRPIAPVGVPHVAARDLKVRDYVIPKGTDIIMNILAMHLDPKLWDDPEVFNPKRFLSDDEKTVIKHEAFAVFGGGRRVCLGEQLARMEFFLFATALLQRFEFVLPEGDVANFSFEHCVGTIVPQTYTIKARVR